MRALISIAVASLIIGVQPCQAQTTGSEHDPAKAGPHEATAASGSGLRILAGYEVHRDHLRYTFANRSNIDTDFLVPHTFTQAYVANNQWLVVSAAYPLGSNQWETEFAITPERQTPGSDLDTFYNPNNDVVVSGTDGEVRLRSFRLAQWSDGRVWGLPWRMGYRYRRDHSQFLPTDRIVTHSNPPSEVRSSTYGHETTISQAHEISIDVSKPSSLSPSWGLIVRAGMSPLIWARLTTILPDKYPGRQIVFDAKAGGAEGRVALIWRKRRPIVLEMTYGRTWSYSAARQFRRDALQGSVGIGFGPEP